jgi:hypothetical protein
MYVREEAGDQISSGETPTSKPDKTILVNLSNNTSGILSDAESINRGIEDTLYINRATAKGWRRQMVDLLGHARLVNAITLARCRARHPGLAGSQPK